MHKGILFVQLLWMFAQKKHLSELYTCINLTNLFQVKILEACWLYGDQHLFLTTQEQPIRLLRQLTPLNNWLCLFFESIIRKTHLSKCDPTPNFETHAHRLRTTSRETSSFSKLSLIAKTSIPTKGTQIFFKDMQNRKQTLAYMETRHHFLKSYLREESHPQLLSHIQ